MAASSSLGLVVIGAVVPQADDPSDPAAGEPLAVSDLNADIPVIGSGPIARLARLDQADDGQTALVDLYDTDRTIRVLTGGEQAAVGEHDFVIERYGYSQAAHRTLSLTFDDGPDPTWTPRLLDLLSAEAVPATFFVTGQQSARYPDLIERIVREGHAVANHSYAHSDVREVTDAAAQREFVLTDRILRSTAGQSVRIFRPPYGGNDQASLRHDALALARAQRLGYVVANFDFDTDDWQYGQESAPDELPVPAFDGRNITMLLHDAGGDRHATIEYVRDLIPLARAAGYTFHTMPQVSPVLAAHVRPAAASFVDQAVFHATRVMVVWPVRLIAGLFALAVFSVALTGAIGIALAAGRRMIRRRRMRRLPQEASELPVSVLIAAFNEAEVIGSTLRGLLASTYPVREFVVVDDGSTDNTLDVVRELQAVDSRIRVIRQANGGKASALNHGLREVKGDIVVTLDADTQFAPDTIANLVRHFAWDTDGSLGAVAGVVKVGNLRGLLTRWQAVEYISQIGVERAAQDALGSIMIVPGACAAWRKHAVEAAGGYSEATLAEDCDLSMSLHEVGFRIVQDDDAIAYTEAPETLQALLKQRTRWVFGTLQALWKHRRMMLNPRHGWLGMVMMPLTAISILVPVVFLPLVYLLAGISVHAEGVGAVLVYVVAFSVIHFVIASIGVLLMRERPVHMLMIPFHRVLYEPLRIYLMYKSIYNALKGSSLRWNKLTRTGSVSLPTPRVPAHRRAPARLPEMQLSQESAS